EGQRRSVQRLGIDPENIGRGNVGVEVADEPFRVGRRLALEFRTGEGGDLVDQGCRQPFRLDRHGSFPRMLGRTPRGYQTTRPLPECVRGLVAVDRAVLGWRPCGSLCCTSIPSPTVREFCSACRLRSGAARWWRSAAATALESRLRSRAW